MRKIVKKYTFKNSNPADILITDNFKISERKISYFMKKADKTCLITDSFCHKEFKNKINEIKKIGGPDLKVFILKQNKEIKTFGSYVKLMEFLFKNGFSRNSLIIAMGGGSVTDMAGFAAATFMRGIDWIAAPTTLLSQIDAGIGGKTAINISGAKNMAGAFHQPTLTVCDISFLASLNKENKISGMGEFIKYLLIMPPKQTSRLTGLIDKKTLLHTISACIEFKMKMVIKDEKDKKGIREVLNFGHTAGHAFESLSKGKLSHGAAIIWGMRFAYLLSIKLNILEKKYGPDIKKLLWKIKLPPLKTNCLNFKDFYNLICSDKKTGKNQNRFLLIKKPETLKAKNNIDKKILKETLILLEDNITPRVG
ncbi:MAG: 3-dehydroquinate synthase family protein [Elusimicrobiota bacterium]|nr:3-dehydroquinate synthase family protein [Elusimicrobiota bacterium]